MMIEGRRLRKSYGSNVLFDDLNFSINDGEYVCFSGNSGTGKSTLLNMIGQIEPFDSGMILYDGKQIRTKKDKKKFFGEKVGFIFQNFALLANETVKSNLEMIPAGHRTNISVHDALKLVGLQNKENVMTYALSGGEQQRVALARLFMKKCEVILADEPTGSLDRENADLVMNVLEYLNLHGRTLILVTHDQYIRNRAGRIIDLGRMCK